MIVYRSADRQWRVELVERRNGIAWRLYHGSMPVGAGVDTAAGAHAAVNAKLAEVGGPPLEDLEED